MSIFEDDLKDSNSLIIRQQWGNIFKKAFGEKTNIEFKDDNVAQLDFGSDAIITTKEGRRYSVEYKTRRFDYFKSNIYLFEVAHHRYYDEECTVKHSTIPGWLYKGTFDYLFYGTLNKDKNKIMEVFGFPLIPFKLEEFKSEYGNFKTSSKATTKFNNSGLWQKTINKLIDKDFIEQKANKTWYWVEE